MSTADAFLLLCEALRFRAALAVAGELENLCATHLHHSSSDAKGLFPAAVFEGQQHAATRIGADSFIRSPADQCSNVPSSASSPSSASPATRDWVHPILDVRRRAEVQVKGADCGGTVAARYTLTGVEYIQGDILGVLEPARDNTATAAAAATGGKNDDASEVKPHTHSLKDIRLATPEPFYDDPLLPALEAIEPHHASKNLLDLWLSKLCGATDKMDTSYNQKRKKAWLLTDEATYLFYAARKQLAEQLSCLAKQADAGTLWSACKVHVTLQTTDASLCSALHLPPTQAVAGEGGGVPTALVVELTWNAMVLESGKIREWLAPPAARADTNKSEVRWSTDAASTVTRLVLPVSAVAVLSLHQRYKQNAGDAAELGNAAEAPAQPQRFFFKLARLLLRYQALSAGQMERESGWQAAVPTRVMDVFENIPVADTPAESPVSAVEAPQSTCTPQVFTVECFASPFNATRRFFFSAFRDTDAPFGSLGNFFACSSAQSCVKAIKATFAAVTKDTSKVELSASTLLRLECNPPFDHEVIAAAFAQLLRWLATAPAALAVSVLVIIPDSTQAHATAVRAAAEQSPLCRWLRSIPAPQCLYVHGAQHQEEPFMPRTNGRKRPREAVEDDKAQGTNPRLIRLSCPTRVFVLQSAEAEQLCAGASVGEAVAKVWRAMSTESSDPMN